MITKFIEYNEKLDFDRNFLKYLFRIAYGKAMKHFEKINKGEYISEDHVLEFINQYMLNNYSIDIPHSKEMYKYVKHLLHRKFLKK